ncbi:MAG: plasmid recombination protein [Aminipila sp.]
MARNDGKDRTFARNERYKRDEVLNMERHNERKNETYKNEDVLLEHKDRNFYLKKPTDTYLGMYDKLRDDEVIVQRGLKKDAHIIDELVFDVNTAYFEKNGGYDYAKEFFTNAYEYAIEKVGGEQYILSAVMHADERHKQLSKELGKDVFHYHLHVTYVPVVKKEIL